MRRAAVTCLAIVFLGGGTAQAQFLSAPACADGLDNDKDGKTDYDVRPGEGDPGCDAWNDADEADRNYSPRVKARLAIIFDTSGSMIWNVCSASEGGGGYTGGDGSEECPGHDVPCCNTPPGSPMICPAGNDKCDSSSCSNDVADDARLYKVKQGLYDAVAAYGELEYALYRFHADPVAFTPCANVTADGQGPFGGWAGADSAGECKPSDLLVKFAPENTDLLLQWVDDRSNWSGAGTPPAGLDFELRGTGFTPLAASLTQAKSDIDDLREGDAAKACRPYRVVLVTDGVESCGGDPKAAATALKNAGVLVYVIGFTSNMALESTMNDIAVAGGTQQAFLVDDPATLSASLAQIAQQTVLIEKCNGEDDDCDGIDDNGFQLGPCNNGQKGACFREGSYVCVSDVATACDAPHVEPGTEEGNGCNGIDDDCDGLVDDGLPCVGCGPEICNGLDDDCNGTPDDGEEMPGVGDMCQLDAGECVAGNFACEMGHLVCKGYVGPTSETCDGKDNDCDGVIDQLSRPCYTRNFGCVDTDASPAVFHFECKGRCRAGTQTCTADTQPNYGPCLGEVGPITELCNGLDDDCDGFIDDRWGLGDECTAGMGVCQATGKLVCSPDGMGAVCDAPVVEGNDEVCNNLDDDCNGVVDDLPEPAPPPIGDPCGTCGGHYACDGGLVCVGGDAVAETCNGKDDDCNKLVDDGDLPGVGDACVPGQPPEFEVKGECKPGVKVCTEGELDCVNFVRPHPEICNGKDDDCDGVLDDMAACPSPTDVCYQAECVSPCGPGEFPCAFGLFCKELTEGRFCVPSKCVGKTCAAGEVCDPDTGMCKDPCALVNCPSGATCKNGRCLDCFQLGCPVGQVCRAQTGAAAVCEVDKCFGVTCDPGLACKEGVCERLACAGTCKGDEVCDEGTCKSRCDSDLCGSTTCPVGQACDPSVGRCVLDPCSRVSCGELECKITCQGQPSCRVPKAATTVLATGGGGFACEVGAARRVAWPVMLLWLALVVAVRRSRRNS